MKNKKKNTATIKENVKKVEVKINKKMQPNFLDKIAETLYFRIAIYTIIPLILLLLLYITFPAVTYASIKKYFFLIILFTFIYEAVKRFIYHSKVTISSYKLFPIFLLLISLLINFSNLIQLWETGMGGFTGSIGSLVPYSDYSAFYNGACSLIENGYLLDISSQRPLGVAFYASLQKLTGGNLQYTYVLLTLLISVTLYISSSVVYKHLGNSVALLFLLSNATSYYPSYFCTESTGLLVGNLAFAFLFDGFFTKNLKKIIIGIFILSVALTVRSGAYFIIPFIILLVGIQFRQKFFNLKVFAIALVVGISGLMCSPIILNFIKPATGSNYQGNFAYNLYGLAKGEINWNYIMTEGKHPELNSPELTPKAKNDLIYKYAFEAIKENPKILINTIFKYQFDGIKHLPDVLFPKEFFSYVNKTETPQFLYFIVFIINLILFFFIKNKEFRIVTILLMLSIIGIIISNPFVGYVGFRVYAATLPINCAIATFGIGFLFIKTESFIHKKEIITKTDDNKLFDNTFIYSALIIFVLFFGPLYVKATSNQPKFKDYKAFCTQEVIAFRLNKGSYIKIVSDSKASVPFVNRDVYLRNSPAFTESASFQVVNYDFYLVETSNLLNPTSETCLYLTFDEDITKYEGKYLIVCAQKIGNEAHSVSYSKILRVLDDDMKEIATVNEKL